MTTDLDRDLRELFLRHERDMEGRGLAPPPTIVRRTRRRQAVTLFVFSTAAIAIAVAGIAGLEAIRASEHRPAVTGPRPSPAPAPSIDWESVPGVGIDGDAIVDIRTGEVTPLPANLASFPDATGYAVAPEGEVLVFLASADGSKKDQIFVANVDGTNLRQLTDAPGRALAGGLSADGSTIVALIDTAVGRSDMDLVLIDVATGEMTLVASGPYDEFHDPHFDFGGQRILVSRFQKYRDLEAPYPQDEGSDVYGIPVAGGDAALVFEDRWNATFSPDGRTIVYDRMVAVGNMGGVEVWLADADGSHRRPLVPNDGPFSSTPSWSPDGTRIVFTKHPGDGNLVAVVDVATGTPTFSVRAPGSPAGVWLDDDTLLVYGVA
jgi:dipeptidyl aminopeptidase/acylaminoacyl peptidase